MALTESHRAHLRSEWRKLVAAATVLDAAAMKPLATLKPTSPIPTMAGGMSLFALANLCFGYARANLAERQAMAPAVKAAAALAGHMLDEHDPAQHGAPASLPFRRDIDG